MSKLHLPNIPEDIEKIIYNYIPCTISKCYIINPVSNMLKENVNIRILKYHLNGVFNNALLIEVFEYSARFSYNQVLRGLLNY